MSTDSSKASSNYYQQQESGRVALHPTLIVPRAVYPATRGSGLKNGGFMAVADVVSEWDDQKLIQHAKDGDRDAFRILMQRHMKRAYNVAYRFVGDHDGAEDVTQEAFVKAYAALANFRGDAEFSTWLHRIVVNIALTKKRLKKQHTEREVRYDDARTVATDTHHEALVRKEQHLHIERALHELPTLQRAVVILRHVNGLSTKQVSDILQCSEGTVKVHLFRGLKKMKTRLAYLQ